MSIKDASVSVVMPSYNERDNIGEAIERITKTLGPALKEIIVVDDNSPDKTWQLIEDLKDPRYKVMRRMDKRGLASALADGTQAATGEIVVWLDCDLGIRPEYIPDLVNALDGYDIAIGSRYVPGGGDNRAWWRNALSYFFNAYTRTILGPYCWDWTSGFCAVRKKTLDEVPLMPEGFGDYFIEWMHACSLKKLKLIEVPYQYQLRKAGVSKTDGELGVFVRLALSYTWRVILVKMKRGSRYS